MKCARELFDPRYMALLARGDDELTLMFVKQALLDNKQR